MSCGSRERLALVGPSGAGKTTIFQLAERFYDPHPGRVLLDGVDLKDADPADIRQRIAMVPQETMIFAASARDNLRYGNWDATEDELWQAARDANAEGFLRALPEGLDPLWVKAARACPAVSASASRLLGHCCAMRRCSCSTKRPRRLDAESERLVQDALDRLMEHRTTIPIRAPLGDCARRRPHRRHGRRTHRRGRHAPECSAAAVGSTRALLASSSNRAA